MAPIPLFVLFSLIHHLVLVSSSAEETKFYSCCPALDCGKLDSPQIPFNNTTHPECGVVILDCSEDIPKTQLREGGRWYHIDPISPENSSFIKGKAPLLYPDFHRTNCDQTMESFSLLQFLSNKNDFRGKTVTLYKCSHNDSNSPPGKITCGDYDFFYKHDLKNNISFPFEKQCSSVRLPIPEDHPDKQNPEIPPPTDITFEVHVSPDCHRCHYEGGKCQISTEKQFYCKNAPTGKGRAFMVKLAIAAAFAGIGVLMIIPLYCSRRFSSNGWTFFWKNQNHAYQSIEAVLRNCGPLQVRRYSYSDVKKMTNSFKEKLGEGGFGSVYKGKLHEGCFVAVKVLNKSKANGEEFINELATISRTSHVNIVTLLGFCFEASKKALIYEFMPNGSLEKFVFDENPTERSYQLDWETHYQISLGIARGLEYLHRGCNTRILHFDIKPHNILLDSDFVPKISDFGLAKICTRKESIVSMLFPRGTIGYIAPEVFNRNFGGVLHKSDVYSYGMMVLEMVGGRNNVNVKADNTSEIYFPQWIYKRLDVEDLGLKRIMNEEDKVKLRKMIMMSLWCIQIDPSNRPAMSRVIEMLEGSLDSLQVPPKPLLTSPPRLPPSESSSTIVSLQV